MRQITSHSGLRGIAATLVVLYHLQLNAPDLPSAWVTGLFRSSYLMVDLFFILSGFIIAYVNAGDRAGPMGWPETRSFMTKRLIRLYPLHIFWLGALVAGTGALIAFSAATGRDFSAWWADDAGLLVAQLLLVNAWLPNPDGWNTPTWSISAELFAYALFPAAIALRGRMPALALIAMLMLSIGFYGAIAVSDGSLNIIGGLAPLRCAAGFFLGTMLFLDRHRISRWPASAIAIGQVVAVLAIVVLLVSRPSDILLIPFFCLLVATSWEDRGPLARLLGVTILQRLGDWSYSIYLSHVPIIIAVLLGWTMVTTRLGMSALAAQLSLYAISLAAVLLLSRWSFAYVEAPSRRWLTRVLLHQRATPIAASPPAP